MRPGQRTILTMSFSLGMLSSHWTSFDFRFERLSIETVFETLIEQDWESAVPHLAHAQLLSELLGMEVPASRRRIQLVPGMTLLVARLRGIDLSDFQPARLDEVNVEFFEVRDWSTHELRLAA